MNRDRADPFQLVYFVNIVLLTLLAFSVPHIEPNSGSYVAAVLSFCVILLSLVGVFIFKRVDIPLPFGYR